ncbi:MAG: UvrD-helicase domain-containing protein [Polyangiaceae bacterium]|nr:UvrD-helicase domain-containing protein [Polyangiaceae bacterium]MCW5789672.1 UvrD-helicase domain-containing protein [Polyangiaceae bacterium]
MSELNAPQRDAVLHDAGPLLVFAGAGSGKTRVITYRVANLLAQGVPPYRILTVTFTNKAARELKERLTALAGEAIARDLWVGTFHSTCVRLLRRYHEAAGLSSHFVIYDDADQRALLNRLIKAAGLPDREYTPRLVLTRIQRKKQGGLEPHELTPTDAFDETMIELYAGYQGALRAADAVDFEDLLVLGTRLAESKGLAGEELRARFDHVLVDEFQDTNHIQYRLVRALAARTQNLCVVGDDDQSIYSWRGADVAHIRRFRKDFKDTTVVKLEQNYRSSANIVAVALGVIERAAQREPKRLFTEAQAGDPVVIHGTTDETEEARLVTLGVADELARGTPANQIAILYRTHAQSRVLENALRARNINYQMVGGTKFFDRAEVKDLLAYLRLIFNPRSDADLLRVVNTPARSIGAKTLDALMQLAREDSVSLYDAIGSPRAKAALTARAHTALTGFHELIAKLRSESARLPPDELAERVLEQSGYVEALTRLDTPEADARLENLRETVGSIREYLMESERLGEEPTLAAYLERVALIADVDGLAAEAPSVVMMTVHAAKGLEFDAVFLTGMEEGIFPYAGLDGDRDDLEEERRLAYVALTRARQRLTVTHASTRMLFGRTQARPPSQFLTDMPSEAIKERGSGRAMARYGGDGYGGHASDNYSDYDGGSGDDDYGASAPSWPRRGNLNALRARMHPQRTPSWAMPSGSPGAARASSGTSARPSMDTPRTRQGHEEPEEGRFVDREAFSDLPEDEAVAAWLREGRRVSHRRFGQGVVEQVTPGSPPKVRVDFGGGYGVRVVTANFLERS